MPTMGTASAATGVIAMVLLTAVVVLGVLVNRRGRLPGLPKFAGIRLHRYLSLAACAFVALHILTAIIAPYAGIAIAAAFVPFTSFRDPFWIGLGAVSSDLLAALIVTSLLRQHIGHRAWRAVHWLSYACWPVALAHGIGSGPAMRSGRLLALAVGCMLAVLAALSWRTAGSLRAYRQARLACRSGAASAPDELPGGGAMGTPQPIWYPHDRRRPSLPPPARTGARPPQGTDPAG